jgi:hypothetical protein
MGREGADEGGRSETVREHQDLPLDAQDLLHVEPSARCLPLRHKVKKPHFTLATSATQFETQNDGILPRSIMIVGNPIEFKEFLKAKFGKETIKFRTLIFDGETAAPRSGRRVGPPLIQCTDQRDRHPLAK